VIIGGAKLLDSTVLAHKVVEILTDKKAIDTVLLDVRKVSLLADYFIISTGEVERHLDALLEEVGRALKAEQTLPLHTEGAAGSGWILMDYGEVIVHLLSPKMRAYYRLEELWKDARMVVRVQ